MNTPHERLTRTTFSLPLGEVHALVGGAVNARPLLFLHGFSDHPPTAVPFLEREGHYGYDALPRHVGHGVRRSGETEGPWPEVIDDAAGSRGARPALQAGRISVVPSWANKCSAIIMWATPRWLHQAMFARVMGA